MKVSKFVLAIVVGLSGLAYAADTDVKAELEALKAQLSAQQSRIAAQEAQISQLKGESWLTERRAEEVKVLIHEVLSDAETRASLLDSGMTAGYQDGFFLASTDGNFRMNIKGQLQIRWVFNRSDQALAPAGTERAESNEGFSLPRVKLGFYGHMFDPKLTYGISAGFDGAGVDRLNNVVGAEDGDFELENAFLAYEIAEGWQIKGGQFKAPFLAEESVHSGKLLAVERSLINQIFTVDYTQGVQVAWDGEIAGQPVRAAAMWHDGSYGANIDDIWVRPLVGAPVAAAPGMDLFDFGIALRGEWLVMGDWAQFEDQQAWSGGVRSLKVGLAYNHDEPAGGNGNTIPEMRKWTVDVSAELPDLNGLSIFFAYIGTDTATLDPTMRIAVKDPWGLVAQVGAFVIPDKMDVFMRYEYADWDKNAPGIATVIANEDYNTITVGTNYYMQGNNAKASLDLVWALDSTNIFNGIGMLGGGQLPGQGLVISQGDQVAVRAQMQMLF